MVQVNMHEAKSRLSQLVHLVEQGEKVIIARDGVPVAEIVPHQRRLEPRRGGQWAGEGWISPDFDDPMPEIEELFGV